MVSTNPFEKYASKWESIFPKFRDVKIKNTPRKMNMVHLKITCLKRKIIWTKPSFSVVYLSCHLDFLFVGIHHPGGGKSRKVENVGFLGPSHFWRGSKGVEITCFTFKGWKIPSISTRCSDFFHLTTTKIFRFSLTGWISEPSDPMFFDTIYANSGEYLDDLCQFCLCQPKFRTARATNEFDV